MIMALMIGGRHRGLPYALDPAVHLPSIFSAKPVARPAVAGLDLASIDRKSSSTFFGPSLLVAGLDSGTARVSRMAMMNTVSRNQATLTQQQLTTLRRALAGGNGLDTVQLTLTRVTTGRAGTGNPTVGGFTAGGGGRPKRPALRGVKWVPSSEGEAEQAAEREKEKVREGEEGIEMVPPREATT
jgi:hypothetical protein